MNRFYLPNGCYHTAFAVNPRNWKTAKVSIKKDWQIAYRFFDPAFKEKHPYGMLRSFRGMNSEKTLECRRDATETLLEFETDLLQVRGFNPITKIFTPFVQVNAEINPETRFVDALKFAAKEIKCEKDTAKEIKSMLDWVEKAIQHLDFTRVSIGEVSRKYVIRILNKCKEIRPHFSAHIFNKYRSYLMSLFKILIRYEAMEVNPVREIEKERTVQKIRLTLTDEERIKIDEQLFKNNYPFWRLLQIFFHSGSRVKELLHVQGKHVDLKKQKVVYTVKKGRSWREVYRPIKNNVLFLWQDLLKDCGQEDFIFSTGLVPGRNFIRREQVTRRWNVHVKKKLGVKADFYSNKHLNITETMDALIRISDAENDVAKLTSHTSSAMIINIYDQKNMERKNDAIRQVNNSFLPQK